MMPTKADQYQFDENGNLVCPPDVELTDEQKVVAESAVLYKEGVSANHPADVAAQYEPPEPPPVADAEGYEDEAASDE